MKKKFRLWDTLGKVFILESPYLTYAVGLNGYVYEGRSDYYFKDNKYVIQQFIGILDKNGKEIYEGDIIELDDGNRGEVKFEGGSFYHTAKTPLMALVYWNEVIGNVFEHPERLKSLSKKCARMGCENIIYNTFHNPNWKDYCCAICAFDDNE